MPTRRELLRSTIPAAAFAAAGGTLGFESIAAAATSDSGLMAKTLPELRFDGVPFADVLEFLHDASQANFNVRWAVMEAAGVKRATPVTMRLRNVPFSTALDVVLSTAGRNIPLGHVITNGVITISTHADLDQTPAGQLTGSYFAPSNFFANGEWKLPKLPYAYDALEPHIDAKTMELHHTKHHQAYVTNLNKALAAIKSLPDDASPQTVEALQRDVSFNMGGHALHSIFWGIIGPGTDGSKMGGEPGEKVAQLINAQFGSFEKFKKYFTTVATTVKGSGWAILAYSPVSQSFVTYAVKDQDSHQPAGTMPILGVDVWEHAYYLKYQNDRAAYVKAWWETVNWTTVGSLIG